MPIITFESGQLAPETKAALIERLTDVAVEVTGIPKHLFFVSLHILPDDEIAVGGKSVAQLKRELAAKS